MLLCLGLIVKESVVVVGHILCIVTGGQDIYTYGYCLPVCSALTGSMR